MTGTRSARARRLLTLPGVLLSALVLAVTTACTPGGPGTPSATPSASDPTTVSINAQPRTVIAGGGELRIPIAAFPAQWNPLHRDGATAQVRMIMGSMLPRLFSYDADGNPAPNPDYLTAVNATGDNPQVVTYTLNPNATWASGRALDAQDFIADWQACNGQNVSFHCADSDHYTQVASVRQGSNPQQVIVTYRGAYDDWPSTFDFLLPREAVADPETFNEGWTSVTKIGEWLAGPFKIGTLDTRAGVLTEPANPDWWGDRPLLSQVTFRVVPPKEVVQAVQDNLIDVADLSGEPAAAAQAARLADCEIREAPVVSGRREVVVARRSLANYGAFGRSTVVWPDVGYLPPRS